MKPEIFFVIMTCVIVVIGRHILNDIFSVVIILILHNQLN